MWTLELPIESYPKILEEYGRGAIITTNVEYFLKDRIKQRGGKITKKNPTLGILINDAKSCFLKKLIQNLKDLNDTRVKIIHGTIGSTTCFKTGKETHFIQKDGSEQILDINFLKKYSKSARKILQKLMTIN